MAAITVWKFDGPDKAGEALRILGDLQKQGLVAVLDAATISWPEGRQSPAVKQAINTTGAGALGGAFWGMLVGFIFLVPVLGAAVGAASGAIAGALTDVGINDDFIRSMREHVVPGTSALVIMSQSSAPDKVGEQVAHLRPQLITTNLSYEDEARLRELFYDHEG